MEQINQLLKQKPHLNMHLHRIQHKFIKSVITLNYIYAVNVPIVPRNTFIIISFRKIDKRRQKQKQKRRKRDSKKYTIDINAPLLQNARLGK